MTMASQAAIEQGYQKMKNLPQEKLVLILNIIDQFSSDDKKSERIKLGQANGKYHIPDDINQYDAQIAELFGE